MNIGKRIISSVLSLAMLAGAITPVFAGGSLPFDLNPEASYTDGDVIYTESRNDGDEDVGKWVEGEKRYDKDTKNGEITVDVKMEKIPQKNDLLFAYDCDGAGVPENTIKRTGKVMNQILDMLDKDSSVWLGDLHYHDAGGPMSVTQAHDIANEIESSGSVVGNPKINGIYVEKGIPNTQNQDVASFHTPKNEKAVLVVMSDGAEYDYSPIKSWEGDNKIIVPIYVGGTNNGTAINREFGSHPNYQDFSSLSDDQLATQIVNELQKLEAFEQKFDPVKVKLTPDNDKVNLTKLTLVDKNGKEYEMEVKSDGSVDHEFTPDVDGMFTLKYEISGEVTEGSTGISVEISSGDQIQRDRIELDVNYEQTKQRERKQELNYDTKYVADSSMLFGETKVVTEGKKGHRYITEEMDSKNGVDNESSIREISRDEEEAIDEVIHVGTHIQVFGDIEVKGKVDKEVVSKVGEEVLFTFDIKNTSESVLTAVKYNEGSVDKSDEESNEEDKNDKNDNEEKPSDDDKKDPEDNEDNKDSEKDENSDETEEPEDNNDNEESENEEDVNPEEIVSLGKTKEEKSSEEENKDELVLQPGESKSVSFKHEVTAEDLKAGVISMALTAYGVDQEGEKVTDSDEVKVDTTNASSVQVVKKSDKTEVKDQGEVINYVITVTNNSDNDIKDIKLVDELSIGSRKENLNVSAPKTELKSGESMDVKYSYTVKEVDLTGSEIKNNVKLTAVDVLGENVSDNDSTTVAINYVPVEPKAPPVIRQDGDEQVIIVNKDKSDKINIDNSDKETITNNIVRTKEEIKEECEEVKACDEKAMEKPLDKPMQNTGVSNVISSANGLYAIGALVAVGVGTFIYQKRK